MPTEEHKVLHMSAGWNFAAAVFKGIGLMVWNPLVPRADVLRFRTQDFQDGHVMLRQYKARQITRTEEDGDPEIIGLMVGDHFLVYLTREGHVYRATISDDAFAASTPITSFRLEQFVTTPKLSYISGSFNHFGLFNTAGDVLFGDEKAQHDTPPRIDPTFQRCGVISLAWGDWHALALFEDGSMFAWGRELRANGCLGMGYRDMEHAREMQLQVDELSVGSRVPRAVTWFSRDRFAFCVAAAGWHSAALVANFTAKK
jgi:SCF-associated factor 1